MVRIRTMLHDENYKRLFASPVMVRDVLRACLPAHRLAGADLSSLGELSPEYVSDELRTRHGDTVWHLRLGRRRAFLLVLLEFQAQDDRLMALRVLTYTGLLLLELVRNQPPEVAGERLPAVLPVVLYNGTEPWTAAPDMRSLITPVGPWLAPYQPAQRYHLIDLQRVAADDLPYRNLLRAVARLEQSRSPRDVLRTVTALRRWLPTALVAEPGRGRVAAGVRGLGASDGRTDGAAGSDSAGDTDAGRGEHDVGRTGRRVAQAVAPGRPRTGRCGRP